MTSEEVKDYFEKTVYQNHPDYEIEIISPSASSNIYLVVHLENEYCYCFLLIPCLSKEEYENRKPSEAELSDFMQIHQFNNCVLKKVCLIYEQEKGSFKHKTFVPENN